MKRENTLEQKIFSLERKIAHKKEWMLNTYDSLEKYEQSFIENVKNIIDSKGLDFVNDTNINNFNKTIIITTNKEKKYKLAVYDGAFNISALTMSYDEVWNKTFFDFSSMFKFLKSEEKRKEVKERRILVNAIMTPDGTVIQSRHTHDFVQYRDSNGKIYAVDGGRDYLSRTFDDKNYTEMSLYDTDKIEKIREMLDWGTRGKNGDEPLRFVLLKDMTNDHINAVLETQHHISPQFRNAFKDELKYRKKHKILLKD